MKREIYEVYAKVVDANGAYNTLSGYPKVYDSHQNNDDCDKARQKAYGEYHTVLGTMYTRTDRQCQIAMIIRANDGMQIECTTIGKIADLPDPKYLVTVNNGNGSGEYEENKIVAISANAPETGYVFDAWDGAEDLNFVSGGVNSAYASFRMPAEAVTVTATYAEAPKYELTVNGGTGGGEFYSGAECTIEADAPAQGMVFDSWEGADGLTFITGSATDAEATIRMPSYDVELTATYKEEE